MTTRYKNTFLTLVAAAIIAVLGSALHWSNAAADGKDKSSSKAANAKKSSAKKDAEKKGKEEETPQIDPMSVNATCYVCHMAFVHEEISSQHFEEKITCVKCHGLSAKHANDENIGATKPDIMYKRDEVDKMCEKCHEDHDVPPREVVARFIKRKLPAKPAPVCTDCHGTHRIEREEKAKDPKAGNKK
ncbi:MAG: hypothetical protein JXM70_04815 [Pirellulales bacterium]|nr:hypothetical protein [Pirellulales bacterium]